MAAETHVSGKDGTVEYGSTPTALEVTQWDFTGTVDNDSFATSSTSGYKTTVSGNKQGSGSIQGKISSSVDIDTLFSEGDLVDVILTIASGSRKLSGSVRVTSLQIGVNVDTGEATTFQISYETHGAYTWAAAS